MKTEKVRYNNYESENNNPDKTKRMLLNIEELDAFESKRVIDSPRSLEACKSQGIDAIELLYKEKDDYNIPGSYQEVTDIRYEGFEQRRKELIEKVKEKRKKIINEEEMKNRLQTSYNNHRGFPFISSFSIPRIGVGYDEIIKRSKERENLLLHKLLKNEEQKNCKYEKEMNIKEINKQKNEKREKEMQINNKKEEEIKIAKEKFEQEMQQLQEKIERKKARERLLSILKEKEQDEKQKKLLEIEKDKVRAQKENYRKQKMLKCMEIQHEIELKQNKKEYEMKQKSKNIEQKLKKKLEMIKSESLIKKYKHEEIRRKVSENFWNNLMKKYEMIEEKQKKMNEKELKMKKYKEEEMERIKAKAELREMKLGHIIEQSQKLAQENQERLTEKQRIESKRLEIQKSKNKKEAEIKRYKKELKRELKQMNEIHQKRKDEYDANLLKERISFKNRRTSKFNAYKEEIIKQRLNNQTESQFQRELIRDTLYHMSVWNLNDINLAENIIKNPKKAFMGTSPSEIIRKKVSKRDIRTNPSYQIKHNFSNQKPDLFSINSKDLFVLNSSKNESPIEIINAKSPSEEKNVLSSDLKIDNYPKETIYKKLPQTYHLYNEKS